MLQRLLEAAQLVRLTAEFKHVLILATACLPAQDVKHHAECIVVVQSKNVHFVAMSLSQGSS